MGSDISSITTALLYSSASIVALEGDLFLLEDLASEIDKLPLSGLYRIGVVDLFSSGIFFLPLIYLSLPVRPRLEAGSLRNSASPRS